MELNSFQDKADEDYQSWEEELKHRFLALPPVLNNLSFQVGLGLSTQDRETRTLNGFSLRLSVVVDTWGRLVLVLRLGNLAANLEEDVLQR